MPKSNYSYKSRPLYALAALMLIGGTAFAQEELPKGEVNLFFGAARFFAYQDQQPRMVLNDGLVGGLRGTWNIVPRFGLEGTIQYGENNLRLSPLPTATQFFPSQHFASHTGMASFGPVFYITPPTHKVSTFIKMGVAGFRFLPTDGAKDYARNPGNARLGAYGLDSIIEVGAMTGFGVKARFSHGFGFRADFDADVMRQPHFRLPSYASVPGAVSIPLGGYGVLYQVTAGVYVSFGGHKEVPVPVVRVAPPPEPTPPPPPEPTLTVGAGGLRNVSVCPGDTAVPIALNMAATTSLPGHNPQYTWTVNGQPVGAPNRGEFGYAIPDRPGQYRVGVTVADDPGTSQDTRHAATESRDLLLLTVLPYSAPTISGAASPAQVNLGDSSSLQVTPQGTECNRSMTYTCTAPEGTLTGNPPNQFNSTGVAFDTDRSRLQTKVVNVVCTVRDAKGGTAQATIPVSVNLAPLQSVRLDDIIFAQNNARVNNCGKRIALEELYPQLTQHPDWEVVLVGHTATGEATNLDRRRVLNVIATISGGKDTCPALEPSRVRFALLNTNQASETKPGFCGTSTRNKTDERSGSVIAQDDAKAPNRRVEVYLVPPGAAVPAGATPLQTVSAADLAPLGCPQ